MSTSSKKKRLQPKGKSVHSSAGAFAPLSAPDPPRSLANALFSSRAVWISLALIAINLFVYASVRHYEFVAWDDPQYITENPQVSSGLTWANVEWAFTTGHHANWHPMTWLSHMLDVQLYGMDAGMHHVTNVVFHLANTLLLFGLLHLMTGRLGRSAFVAGLFAVHPLHVESVAWVAERKDVLSTLFFLLMLWAYVEYVRNPQRNRYLLVVVLLALGLMSKPMLVTAPFVLLLLDVWPLQRVSLGGGSGLIREQEPVWQLVREKLPLIALSIVSSIVTVLVQQQGGALQGFETFPWSLRVGNALVSYLAYIVKMLWPDPLVAFYPFPRSVPVVWLMGAILILVATSAIVLRLIPRHPYLAVGWFWYLGTLIPVIGLVQVGDQAMADRYTYIPLIGLFLMVAWGVPELLPHLEFRNIALSAAGVLVLLGCVTVARGQARSWENTVALWEHALQGSPNNYNAHTHLAVALAGQGRIDEALAHLSEAVRLEPDNAEAHNNLGAVLIRSGRIDEAVTQLSEAVHIQPAYADAHNNLGMAFARQDSLDKAIQEFQAALRINPGQASWRYNLAVTLRKKGDTRGAAREFESALNLDPTLQGARQALSELETEATR